MELLQHDDHEALSKRAADLIHAALLEKPDLLLCAATGATPTRTYQLLGEKQTAMPRTFEAMRVLKLDEWLGLRSDDDGSCERYLQTHLIAPLHLPPEQYAGFDASVAEPAAECARIADWLSTLR